MVGICITEKQGKAQKVLGPGKLVYWSTKGNGLV
jgi:hypothetical protein